MLNVQRLIIDTVFNKGKVKPIHIWYISLGKAVQFSTELLAVLSVSTLINIYLVCGARVTVEIVLTIRGAEFVVLQHAVPRT